MANVQTFNSPGLVDHHLTQTATALLVANTSATAIDHHLAK